MMTPFEKWITENHFPDAINDIFSDAAKCYKNGVYRAALMLSFVGMMKVLRERILQGDMPTIGWTIGEWQQIQIEVTRDDEWERYVLNAVKKLPTEVRGVISKSPIFSTSPDIRSQVSYWKDRRNDCAHYKSNHIDHYHVEGFWAFLQSNLNKLNIEGGMMSLFNKFVMHYNPSMTPENADVTPLVLQIEQSVTEQEIEGFWFKLIQALDPVNSFPIMGTKDPELIETIFTHCSGYVKNSLIKLVRQTKTVMTEFVVKYPHRVVELGLTEVQIRQLWRKDLINNPYRYEVVATLLNTGLIPADQIEEVIKVTVCTMTSYDIKSRAASILNSFGFQNAFEEYFFNKRRFSDLFKTNERGSMLSDYIRFNGFSKHTVEILCWEYNRSTHSFTLLNRLSEMFNDLPNRKSEFRQMAINNSIAIPTKLDTITA